MRVMLLLEKLELATSIFDALSEQGRVESALQRTPFARAYGARSS
jgi:hypothetical protein